MALDFEEIWQEHRRFIVSVAAGAAIFSGLSYARASVETSCDRTARANASEQERLQSDLGLLEGKEGLEKGRRDGLTKSHEAVMASLAWDAEEPFKLPAGEKNLPIFVAGAANAAAEAIGRRSDRDGVKAPRTAQELGIDAADAKDDAARAQELLARADVVKRVVLAAIEAGARRVGPVRQAESRYLDQPAKGDKPQFLRVLPIKVSLEIDAKGLAKLLDRFEEKGRFLEVNGLRASRPKDQGEAGRLEVDVELVQVAVVDAAPVDSKGRSAPGPGEDEGRRRPTRPRRGER